MEDSSLILDNDEMTFCVYGLGKTGISVVNYFNRKKFTKYYTWDDNKTLRSNHEFKFSKNKGEKNFSQYLDSSDYIILSPGINLYKAKLKKKLVKNKKKIITDLDLFYLCNPKIKTIIITGTNGKSSTCKILEHTLRKNNINVRLGGNIGKPVLDLNLKDNPLLIIEASSFQLAHSKFIEPNQAVILNIHKDHLDWHGSFKNYLNSKLKVFSNQNNNDLAFLNNKLLIKDFIKAKYKSKLKIVSLKKYLKIKNKIKNNYLKLKVNDENMSFIYALSKIYNIKEKSLIKSFTSFKGLPHRQEIFYKKKNLVFINDSKATSFDSTKFALKDRKNIFWITGGLPKKGDRLKLGNLKNNIAKTYIIGKHMKFFQKQLKGKTELKLCKSLEKAITTIFKDIKKIKGKEKITVLLSPASASYDQYKNFEIRGNEFKKLSRLYAKKFI